MTVGACLHVTSETANLVRTLRAGGAEVALCAPNPLSTQDDVAAALADDGVEVHAIHGEDMDAWAAHVVAVAAGAPQITLDDGADLVTALHAQGKPPAAAAPRRPPPGSCGCAGSRPRARSQCPVIAVNEAFTERAFNDRHGTGQSAIDGIIRATNLLLAGRTLVVHRLRLDRPGRRAAREGPRRAGRRSARSTRCARSRRAWTASRSCPR